MSSATYTDKLSNSLHRSPLIIFWIEKPRRIVKAITESGETIDKDGSPSITAATHDPVTNAI